MKEFYDVTKDNKFDPYVRLIQLRLNSIRDANNYNWEKLSPDGIYGRKTKSVVASIQEKYKLSPVSGILGPTTAKCIIEKDSPKIKPYYQNSNTTKNGIKETYNITSYAIGATYTINSAVDVKEKNLAYLFNEWNKVIEQQYDSLLRRISKFPEKKQMRARNVIKQLDKCQKFVEKARKYGINTATIEIGNNLTKENAIKYIAEIGETINKCSLMKTLRAITTSFEKIKNIISPVVKFLNKIPGLKYFSVIDKMVRASIKMIQCDFEGAFKLYLDALRELVEQIIIDAVVVAAIVAGGWVAIVIAIVIIIGAMLLDYFFFSDNPGESLADKHLQLKTRNVIQNNVAPWTYHAINK